MDALEFLCTQFDVELGEHEAYPSSLADSDFSISLSQSDADKNPSSRLPPQNEQSQQNWAIARFLHDNSRSDSIRLGLHCRHDAKSHSQTLMADIDSMLDAIQGS